MKTDNPFTVSNDFVYYELSHPKYVLLWSQTRYMKKQTVLF